MNFLKLWFLSLCTFYLPKEKTFLLFEPFCHIFLYTHHMPTSTSALLILLSVTLSIISTEIQSKRHSRSLHLLGFLFFLFAAIIFLNYCPKVPSSTHPFLLGTVVFLSCFFFFPYPFPLYGILLLSFAIFFIFICL